MKYSEKNYPLQKESYEIIGICMEVHRNLGQGFLEIVYKDAIEWELQEKKIPYEREKQYDVNYKGITLQHNFYADFVVYDKIILEVKSVSYLVDEFTARTINYLKCSDNKLGLLVNFGELKLVSKRIVLDKKLEEWKRKD